MDIEAARDTLAAAAASYTPGDGAPAIKLTGYREPAGELNLPAFVVLDPHEVQYHQAYGTTPDEITLYGRIVVALSVDTYTARPLDRLLAPSALPATLEAFDSDGVWEQLRVVGTRRGPWAEYQQDRRTVGLSTDLEIRIQFPEEIEAP